MDEIIITDPIEDQEVEPSTEETEPSLALVFVAGAATTLAVVAGARKLARWARPKLENAILSRQADDQIIETKGTLASVEDV